jgi:transposase InsO family protein
MHVDFAEKDGVNFLLEIDLFSKWPEFFFMNNTTSLATIEKLRFLFAAYGLPKILVSDNGPQLDSKEFEEFLSKNGVKYVKTATYKPSSNGQAERFVKTFTQLLVKSADSGNMSHRIAKFIFSYRNTPNTVTGETPS